MSASDRSTAPKRRRLPGPVADAVAFYRGQPLALVVALVAGSAVAALVLTDGGGIDIGEAFSMVAIGIGVGVVIAATRRGGR